MKGRGDQLGPGVSLRPMASCKMRLIQDHIVRLAVFHHIAICNNRSNGFMEKIDVGRGKNRGEGLGAEHGERCYPMWRFIKILLIASGLGA